MWMGYQGNEDGKNQKEVEKAELGVDIIFFWMSPWGFVVEDLSLGNPFVEL